MRKNAKKESRRVLARNLATELSDDALKSITGGCGGTMTCTLGGLDADYDTPVEVAAE